MEKLALSYVHGGSTVSLIGETIGIYFDRMVTKWSKCDALVVRHQNVRWSYEDLKGRVDSFASGLLKLGLDPGDRVGIWSPNNAEWVVAQFATAKAGLILVNINPAYQLSELEYVLNAVRCKALITATKFKSSNYISMLTELAPEVAASDPGSLRSKKLPHLRSLIQVDGRAPGFFSFDEVAKADAPNNTRLYEIARHLQFDDAINIQFTSGTTGKPKGATLTHHNILNNGYFIGETMRITEVDRICIPVPLYHCFGMVIGNLACVTHGATMVYPSEAFDPLAVLETIEGEGCTALYGVPTMFIAELTHPKFDSFDLRTLRTGVMAGAPCPIEVMNRVVDEMHMSEVTIAYGMTETSPVSFQTATDDPRGKRVGTVGSVHPHVEVKIINDKGHIVPIGEQGELCVRGYTVMLGYWSDKQRTSEAIDNAGWMHTGDLAIVDSEGYGKIVGRVKDMVIRGGENIYPREVEEFLYTHPKIEDVQIVGVPDSKYGEELCAWIKVRVGESLIQEEVQDFCQGKIAHYKIPHYVKFVDSFPMTVTGKIQKFIIREKMIAELDLTEK